MRFESSNLNPFQPKDDSTVGGGIAGDPVNAVSVLFVLLSILYIGFGLTLYCSERSPLVSAARREPLLEESKRSANDRLFLFWVALVIIVALLLLSVVGIQRAAQNAANHQTHFELVTCVIWSAAAWAIITVIGILTLKARGHSTKLLTGTFYGCLVGYSVLSLVFAVYFAGAVSLFEWSKNQCNPARWSILLPKTVAIWFFSFSLYLPSLLSPSLPLTNAQAWHKDYQGSVTTGETAFAVISLVIGVLCAGFSNSIFTYRHSIIKVNAADSGLPVANTSQRSIT
jgi:Ca2+/Na+ antiporter